MDVHAVALAGLLWSLFSMGCSLLAGGMQFHLLLTTPKRWVRFTAAILVVVFGVLFLIAGRMTAMLWSML